MASRITLDRSKKSSRNSYARDNSMWNSSPKKQTLLPRRGSSGWGGGPSTNEEGLPAGQWLRWCGGCVLGGCLLLALVVGLLHAYRYATTSEYFAIREIRVNGTSHFDRESVLKTAGLREGMNSLSVNIADVERALRQTPWVARVSVKRSLPDVFEILIDERLPAFWVLKDNGLVYADSKGNLIAPVEPENFLSLPALELDQGGELLLESLDDFVAALRKTTLPLEIGTASWVRLSAARGFELYLEKHGLTVSIGWDDWQGNLRHLGLVLTDLARRGEIRGASEVWATDGNAWVLRNK